jgi:hypothetical protein
MHRMENVKFKVVVSSQNIFEALNDKLYSYC